MPLKRYEIRNEYSLADPELYKVADKDDPEAILEGVAMAGLVGVLRQLGDLAEFAAEIFHDLHEEVMSTAARGHGLIVRVQQLEAEFPSIERKLLSQTSHTSFLYNSGVDWHPNLRMDQNTITQGDLPRFVMDSYEECRGPPRLFLLDKFDVAGAGACLKRFTDPSFFKTESASATGRKSESQREKKTRRVKKRGPRWRNGDTPESFPSSHAKLHQLFLEERIENGGNDPDRRVKLKKRQFTGSLFDQENTTSYMEKFLDTCPPEQRIVHEIIDPLSLTWPSHNDSESGLEIVEIGTASPHRESIKYDRRFCSSPDATQILVKPSVDESSDGKLNVCIDSEAVEELGLTCSSNDGNIPTMSEVVYGKKVADRESKSEASIDDLCNSDDVASETDNYVDALATIESEAETDSDFKKYPRYLSLKPVVVDSDGSLGQQRLQEGFLDSQSVGNSATSEDGNNFFGERGNSSCANSVNAISDTTVEPDVVITVDPSASASNSDIENIRSDHHFSSEEIAGSEAGKHAMAHVVDIKANGNIKGSQEFEESSSTSSLTDSNTKVFGVGADAHVVENSLLIDEVYSNSSQCDIASREMDQTDPVIATGSSNGTVPDFLLKADSGEDSTQDQAGHINGVLSDTLPEAHNSPDLRQLENQKAHSISSSVEEYSQDIRHADVDAYSDSTGSFEPLSIFVESPDIVNPICAPSKGGLILSAEGNTNNSDSALDSKESFNIPEQHSEIMGYGPTELEQGLPYIPTVGQAMQPSSSGSEMLDPTAGSSSFGVEASEIVEGDSVEAEITDSGSGYVPVCEIFPSYAHGKVNDDSFKIAKPLFPLDLLETEDKHQTLQSDMNDAALSVHCQAETKEANSGNHSTFQKDSGSMGKVDKNAAVSMLERELAFQDFPTTCPIQTNAVQMISPLNDPDTNAVDVEAEGDCALSDQIEDGNNVLSDILSDIPHKHMNEPDAVTVADNDGDLKSDVEKVNPVETITDSSRLANHEDDHQTIAIPMSSSTAHPEKLQDPFFAVTEECHQNGHESREGHTVKLTENKLMDPVLSALLESNHNMCDTSTHESSTISLDSLLPQDNEDAGKHILGNPLASGNSSHDVESASAEHIHQQEVKQDYVDSHKHELLKPKSSPENAMDIASIVTSVHESSPVPDIHDKELHTPGNVARGEYVDTAAAYNQSEPFVSNAPQLSAEQILEVTTEPSVGCMSISADDARGPELVYPPEFPVLAVPASKHQTDLEAPPLPPLPPMQWRLGRFQNSSSAPERQQRVGQLQVQSMYPPGVHHTLGPVQTMSLPTVNHGVTPAQPIALPAVHYTLAPAQPMTLPAMHYTLAPVLPMTVPTLEHQTVATAQRSMNEGQPGSLDEYVALQGGIGIPMMGGASEGLARGDISAFGRQEHPIIPVPTTGYTPLQGGFSLPMIAPVSEGSSSDSLLLFDPSTSAGSQGGTYISENFLQPNVGLPEPDSSSVGAVSEHNPAFVEAIENADTDAQGEPFVSKLIEQESSSSSVQSLPSSTVHQQSSEFVASEADRTWLSTYDGTPSHAGGSTGLLQKKVPRPRNPLIDEVVAIDKSKFRKVERVKPSFDTKAEEGEFLREQMQLRKVEKVKPVEETKATEGGYILEHLRLRKVVERAKQAAEPKSEDREFLSEQLQLRKVGERLKPDVELKSEETDSPRVQLRKVNERVKQETEARTEETESPRMQLRKVGEKTEAVVELNIEERDSLLDQIRNKSFSLKPAVAARPNIQGPRTNLKVAAILEKASNIRQAMAGSDEDDDADTWSDC